MNQSPHQVELRVIFLRIGDIKTVNENFFAEILIESRWEEPNLSSEFDKSNLFNEEKELQSAKKYWNPNIYIENSLNDTQKNISYKIMKKFTLKKDDTEDSNSNLKYWLYEYQQIKGHFFQKLKLKYFPLDVQDLSIMVTTFKSNKEVVLVQSKEKASVISSSMTIDKNIWHLYPIVEVKGNEDMILNETNQNSHNPSTSLSAHSLIKFPFIMFQCKVSRRAGYYFWNAYFLIFLITAAVFAIFAVNPNQPNFRLPVSATLLLTSITFRWSYSSRCLPTVNYFTSLDSYSIKSIVLIFLCFVWHGFVTIFFNFFDYKVVNIIDKSMLGFLFLVFILINLSLVLWLKSAFKIRKSIESYDRKRLEKRKSRFSQSDDISKFNLSYQFDDVNERNSIFSVVNNIDMMNTLNENHDILRRYSLAFPLKMKNSEK